MNHKNNFNSIAVASRYFIFLFLLFLFATSAASASSAGTYAYITSISSNSVSVINTSNNTIVATIPVGAYPYGVAVSPDGSKAYVANQGSGTVSVINTTINNVAATVDVGSVPWGVAVSPDGKKVYVTHLNWVHTFPNATANVSVIDTANNSVSATVKVGIQPCGVAFAPDGTKAYVTNSDSNNVSVIETTTNTVISTVNVGSQPWGVAISPDGTKAYVANYNSNNVSIIDTANNSVVATVPVGNNPYGIAVSPDGSKVYVGNYGSSSVSVINTTNNSVVATVNTGGKSHGVSITPDGNKVYVASENGNVYVIDTANNNVTATVNNAGNNPIAFGQFIEPLPEQPVLPVVSFSSNVTMGKIPLTVKFTDQSGNATAWKWDFGDGTNSTQQNPMHTYSAKGNYTVTLTVNNSYGSNILTKNNYISATKPDDDVLGDYAPFTVKFMDQSENATSWKWDFGDGNSSTIQNPTYTYNKVGLYTVTLTVTNAAGSNVATKASYISVGNSLAAPVAAFSASTTIGKAPLNVSFTDTSTGSPTFWMWSFGDGNTSNKQNPENIYSKPGQYSVSLTVTNAAGSSTITKYYYIGVVNSLTPPVAAFSASAT